MSDIIDLTDTSPAAPGGEAAGGRKRERSPAAGAAGAEEIVLLSDDEGGPADEARQRRNIMDFARQVRQRQQGEAGGAGAGGSGGGSGNGAGSSAAAGSGAVGDEGEARRRIMAHATDVNAQRGIAADAGPAPAAAAPAAAGSNSLLAQLHAERMARRVDRHQPPPSTAPAPSRAASTATAPADQPPTLTILSWNVWFREDVAVHARMAAIAGIVAGLQPGLPDVIALQEMTPYIYSLLSSAPWWRRYTAVPDYGGMQHAGSYFTVLLWRSDLLAAAASGGGRGGGRSGGTPPGFAAIDFENSAMGRDLKAVSLAKGGRALRVATTHLESPTSWKALHSAPRQAQCRTALEVLSRGPPGDALLVGDLNWTEKNDGAVPLPPGWVDVWAAARPGDPGFTYDAQRNEMLGKGKRGLRLRLDRALARLGAAWELEGMEMVGTEALPGQSFDGKPVLPSDHYGLVVRLRGTGAGGSWGGGS